MTSYLAYPNQGQKIVLNWNNAANLRDWTSYTGTDGKPFLPPNDRNGFSDGVARTLPTGRVLMAGNPISEQTFPWVSDGQVDYLEATFTGQNVTVAIHKPSSVGKTDTVNYNAVVDIDLNQTKTLQRRGDGYENFVVRLVLVEPL